MNTITPKIIIVEGQDRCGKSTLIKSLRKHIQNPKVLTLSSSSPPSFDTKEWSKKHYKEMIDLSIDLAWDGWTIIADRFHIGETVYGPIFRNDDSSYIWEFDEHYRNNPDVWLITIVDYAEDLIARDDGQSNEKNRDDFEVVRLSFIDSHRKSSIKNKILINISDNGWANPQTILEKIYA